MSHTTPNILQTIHIKLATTKNRMAGNNNQITSVTELVVESANSFPTKYSFFTHPKENVTDDCINAEALPVIDFSLLESSTPEQYAEVIKKLTYACENWGFFMVVNHGVPESLMKAMIDKCHGFFKLSGEEKREFEGKYVLDPIRCGTSYSPMVEKVSFWRDFLKIFTRPKFHCPTKPSGFSETLSEYSEHVWRISKGLLGGISFSLGLHEQELEKLANLESGGQQTVVANYYPPCPRPDLAIGLPPHSDHGLITLLIHNGVGGLQILRDGKWVAVDSPSNAFLVNVADQLEIFTNGRYRSILHRATVNNTTTRISIAILNGPSFDTNVHPAEKLINKDETSVNYKPMTYQNYFELQQSNRLDGKSALDIVRINQA